MACSNLSGVINDNSSCSTNPLTQGNSLSYRIVFKGLNLANGEELSSLASACIKDTDLTNSDYNTNYKLPLNVNGNFPFAIAAYEGLNCEPDDLEATYLFQAQAVAGKPNADSQFYRGPAADETSFFFADNYTGVGDNTFAASGMLPPAQTIQYRYDDPTESGGGGDSYQNTREVFNSIVGTQNLTSPWALGARAKLTTNIADNADEIIGIESASPTDIFNGLTFVFNELGTDCAISTAFDSGTNTLTVNFCPQIDAVPTYTTTNDLVNSLNTALTNNGFIPGLNVINLRPSSNLSGTIITSTTSLNWGKAADEPWKRNSGLYGEIAGAFHGHLGAMLFSAGYETCSEIPTSGSFQYELGDRDIVEFRFSTGKVPMVHWMNSFGTLDSPNIFEKRVAFYEEGQMREFYEFNCTGNTLAGFYRSNHIDGSEDHRTEAYYDAQNDESLKFEYITYDYRNQSGQETKRKQWSYLVSDNAVQNVKLWTTRYNDDITMSIEHGDVYAAQVTDSVINTSSKHYDSAQLLSGHISFETNTDTHQDYSYDGTPTTSSGFTIALPVVPSTLSINKLHFPKLMANIPNNLAPMAMSDSRLFTNFSPNMTYQAYTRTMEFFDDWNSRIAGVSGCLADVAEVHNFLLKDNSSLFPSAINYVYANNFQSVYSLQSSLVSSNGCTQITWEPNFNDITIDPLSFKNHDGTAAVSADELTAGTQFSFSIPTTILSTPQTFTDTLIATNEPLGTGSNKGSLRLFGDQVYEPLTISPLPSISETPGEPDFTLSITGYYPGTILTAISDGAANPFCSLDTVTYTSIDCTIDDTQAQGDQWDIMLDNTNLSRNTIQTTTIQP